MRRGSLLAARAGALAFVVAGFLASSTPSIAAPDSDETCDGMTDELTGPPVPAKSHDGTNAPYEVLPDVHLPTKVEERIKVVADAYHKNTGKSLVVTSGTRSPSSQAEVIYAKIAAGDDVVKLYKNKTAALELKHLFDEGKAAKRDRAEIILLMTDAIRAQIKKGVFISAHLRSGAADVRSTDMTTTDKRHFVEASEVGGLSVMLEATPPHFHLQIE